jgi:uncharacterized protein YcfJ
MYVKTVHLNLLLVHKKVDNTTESLYIIRVKQREDSQMKKLLTITALMTVFGSAAIAQTQRLQATVIDMRETYQDVVKPVPVQSCNTVEVPIYETRRIGGQASTGDTLAGALIGGVIGNQFGGGKGKDAATVLGAILGADAANKKGGRQETVIVGYRQQQQCSTSYENKQTTVRGDNVVTVELENGSRYEFYTKGWYRNGNVVFLNVDLQE